jgi:hypothetical protein
MSNFLFGDPSPKRTKPKPGPFVPPINRDMLNAGPWAAEKRGKEWAVVNTETHIVGCTRQLRAEAEALVAVLNQP